MAALAHRTGPAHRPTACSPATARSRCPLFLPQPERQASALRQQEKMPAQAIQRFTGAEGLDGRAAAGGAEIYR